MKRLILAFAVMLVAVLSSENVAMAQRAVDGEVLVILAKEEEGTVDPALRSIAALRRPPFNGYASMSVLDRPHMSLRTGQPTTVNLPNGRRLQIVLQQVMPNGRYRVRVSINRPEQNDYLPLLSVVASPGDPFFVAGQRYQGGTLVIGVRVGASSGGGTPAAAAGPGSGNDSASSMTADTPRMRRR